MKNKDNLKISVITPSFNQGQFIEETIKSVQNQTYKNFEHIVVDGGSTDNTLSILKKYTGKIKWISEKDKGQSDAINKGLKMAKGDILCYLNSDDLFYPNTLENVVKFFQKNSHAKWVTGDYQVIDEKGKEIRSFVPIYKKIWAKFPYKITCLLTNFINQPSTFWKREVFENVGFFKIYKYNMDFDYWIRIFNKGYNLYVINDKLSKFRIHTTSLTGSQYKEMLSHMIFLVKQYTNNQFIIFFNKLHYGLVKLIYERIYKI